MPSFCTSSLIPRTSSAHPVCMARKKASTSSIRETLLRAMSKGAASSPPTRRRIFRSSFLAGARDDRAQPGVTSLARRRSGHFRMGLVMNDDRKIIPFGDGTIPQSKRKKVARKRIKRARDPEKQTSQHLQPRTAEDLAREQTAEQLALRIWAAMVAQKVLSGMSALADELIESHLLDDDDEEADEGWLDDHRKREKRLLDEAISDGLDKFPDFAAINNLPPGSDDPDIARDGEQLKDVLTKCAIDATEFRGKFPRAHLERMVKRELKIRFKRDPK